ncbi:uncharacterized protein BT62DRAFT_620534 [Guyanagaster necrorhizus]|uniref:Uncharacterized protein n=1 Tax=Guyanagaster necrorhizus TaxID=856835 RepID=A0A9P7W134_9AGAR|nr:uncharacterized protein BT62DRAFT_620534 [Guyanagaster necrorhizus MCA 3950]KAG7450029.1 hypothetical protein BT62DRAFT_620534 [Guyanagaster necrorhizus MCA 3950]
MLLSVSVLWTVEKGTLILRIFAHLALHRTLTQSLNKDFHVGFIRFRVCLAPGEEQGLTASQKNANDFNTHVAAHLMVSLRRTRSNVTVHCMFRRRRSRTSPRSGG